MPYLLDNLISFWELEEASGTRVDAHSTNDLTDVATVTQQTGKVGNCAQFTAANAERLTHAHSAALTVSGTSFSIAAWIYLDSTGSGRAFVGKNFGTSDSDCEFQMGVAVNGGGGTQLFVFFQQGGQVLFASDFGALSANTWYFATLVFEAGGTLRLSINGVETTAANTTTIAAAAAASFAIGDDRAEAGGFPWDGRVDQLGLWKRTLSAAEIAVLYNSGAGRSYAGLTTVPSLSYRGRFTPGSLSSGATVTGADIGTAASDRTVFVGITGIQTGHALSGTSMTIGGNAATLIASYLGRSDAGGNAASGAMFALDLATGTTADIAYSWSGGDYFDLRAFVWAAYGMDSASIISATDITLTGGTVLDASLNAVANGAVVAMACVYGMTIPSFTWAGVTADAAEVGLYGNDLRGSASVFNSAGSPLTVTLTIPTVAEYDSYGVIAAAISPVSAGGLVIPTAVHHRKMQGIQ